MIDIDERELLLLGLLKREEMHGYQLSQFLEHRLGSLMPMKRSTAYFLLKRLSDRGLVEEESSREGRRPERRIYRLTAVGAQAFDVQLRRHLVEYTPAYFPDAAGLLFLDLLTHDERIEVLRRKLELIRDHRLSAEERLRSHVETPAHWMMSHRASQLRAEEGWVEQTLAGIESGGGAPEGSEREHERLGVDRRGGL